MIVNLSDEVIEKTANKVRAKLGMDFVYAVNPETLLQHLKKKISKFDYRAAQPGELEEAEAFMDCETQVMILSDKVMNEMMLSKSRSRFTVAHELGHYFLGHSGNTKRHPDKTKYHTPKQKLQEQQADKFASYLLVPTKLALTSKSAKEIEDRFQVSGKVAEIAFERIQAALRKEKGELRRPPALVIDFLKEAEKLGYKVRSNISDFT